MSKLKVLNSSYQDFEVPIVINDVLTSSRTEVINSDNTISFSMVLTNENKDWINDMNTIGLGTDLFDIAKYKKAQAESGELAVTVDCEHVSYQLNNSNYDKEYFAKTGTPAYVFGQILDGTPFSVGTVEFIDAVTYSIQEKMSRRAMVVQFAEYLGGELSFDGFTISILAVRGSATPKDLMAGRNITVISKEVDKTKRDELGNPTVAYECALIYPMALALGDVVTLDYNTLGINVSLRIVSITTNPYNQYEVSFSVSNTAPAIEDAAYYIATTTVGVDKYYNNCRIGPTYGFEAVLADKWARSYFCSTAFAMQVGDGTGNTWTNALYFDPGNKRYVFDGDIILRDGVITWEKLDGTSAENGVTTIAETWISTRKVFLSELNSLNEANPIIYLFTHGGTAQNGTDGTITLASNASPDDDTYNGMTIEITAGIGSGQTRTITDYSGSVRIAYVDSSWDTNPDNTSVYLIKGPSIDATANNEQGVGQEIRLKWNKHNYYRHGVDRADFYFKSGHAPNVRPNNFYVNDNPVAVLASDLNIVYNAGGTGFTVTADGTSEDWTWTKDVNGRITQLSSATGRTISVTY